jgi:site-specific DNA-methyltransferase (adenine-specific)
MRGLRALFDGIFSCYQEKQRETEMGVGLVVNQLHQGDCVLLLEQVEEGSVDLVFADPPFNIGYEYDVYEDRRDEDEYVGWCRRWIDGIYRALKPHGTFWLAIGDEYAAELKIEAKRAGFICRSWVIWYYTFGVNCTNGFSRSHTHLFHFVKHAKKFTFNRMNPQIRVKSARQLVYADGRANPIGRLPDNTWITRPQDAPWGFSPNHDTWYFSRVAGTFKEREGFHGCQMPEQLLARIIRASSNPNDLVLDPFGGSGTTLCVSKKLGRQWMGFELSEEYAQRIRERMERTQIGDPLDGTEDSLASAPSTSEGKKRRKPSESDFLEMALSAFSRVGGGLVSLQSVLCDPEFNAEYQSQCLEESKEGNPFSWNQRLFELKKENRLPAGSEATEEIDYEIFDRIGYACEVAWRLMALDYHQNVEEILCSPESLAELERVTRLYGGLGPEVNTKDIRRAVWHLRSMREEFQSITEKDYKAWKKAHRKLPKVGLEESLWHLGVPGVYALSSLEGCLYVGESVDIQRQITKIMENPEWKKLRPDSVIYLPVDAGLSERGRVKAMLIHRERPLLNAMIQ